MRPTDLHATASAGQTADTLSAVTLAAGVVGGGIGLGSLLFAHSAEGAVASLGITPSGDGPLVALGGRLP